MPTGCGNLNVVETLLQAVNYILSSIVRDILSLKGLNMLSTPVIKTTPA